MKQLLPPITCFILGSVQNLELFFRDHYVENRKSPLVILCMVLQLKRLLKNWSKGGQNLTKSRLHVNESRCIRNEHRILRMRNENREICRKQRYGKDLVFTESTCQLQCVNAKTKKITFPIWNFSGILFECRSTILSKMCSLFFTFRQDLCHIFAYTSTAVVTFSIWTGSALVASLPSYIPDEVGIGEWWLVFCKRFTWNILGREREKERRLLRL